MSRILLSDPNGTGGVATHVSLLAEHLVARGHDVDVHVGWSQAPRASEHEATGATVRVVPSLVELLLSESFDVVNICNNALVHLRPEALRRSRSPIVVTVHARRQFLDVRGTDALVFVTPGQVIRCRPSSALGDAVVIRNPVALDRFTVEGRRSDLGDRPVVAWIARPTDWTKGVGLFVEIARQLGPSFQPLIVTEATEMDAARRLLTSLPHARVATRAWRDMPALLRGVGDSGGCVLMTSRTEGDPLLIGEALGCGVPVVSSNIAGIEDWIATGGVSTFERDHADSATLGAAAVTARTSPGHDEKDALALRQTVPAWRSLPAWVDAFEAVYDSLPPRRRAGTGSSRVASAPAAQRPGPERIGVAMVTFDRPDAAQRCLAGIASLGSRVSSVCVVDNGGTRPIRPPNWAPDVALHIVTMSENEGLPAAHGLAFDALPNCDAVLVLDDDTVISPQIFDDLLVTLRDGVGVAAAANPACDQLSPYDRPLLFPWSPSLIRRDAIEDAGVPDRRLFFGYDDYDFALRLDRVGWRVASTSVPIPERRIATVWPERRYFGVRNALWLATRRWPRSPVFWRLLVVELRQAVHAIAWRFWRRRDVALGWREGRAAFVGLVHGVAGRVGPPPAWVLTGRPSG
jgi:glycosyltransferase involved in cell wall biosynthesis